MERSQFRLYRVAVASERFDAIPLTAPLVLIDIVAHVAVA